uniref:Ribosomal protein L23 n=1 Tax=Lindera metcalfiana TaxID=155294 RepID=A0A345BD85_9MAGN|nr:ribosomal protein L23 [Lindera metcalfiana]
MDGIKYVVFTEKVFGYWGTINILLM